MSSPADVNRARTVVIGLGNPLLSDDGLGLQVVRHAATRLGQPVDPNPTEADARPASPVDLKESYARGFDLLHDLTGYDRAIIVDALDTQEHRPGQILTFPLRSLAGDAAPPAGGTHVVDLPTLLTAAERCGMAMPRHVVVMGVVAADLTTFAERLTPAVAAQLDAAVDKLMEMLAASVAEVT